MNYSIELKHISTINSGDTIKHNNEILTVCKNNIKNGGFMGTTIFGDSYNMGHKLVEKVTIIKTNKCLN